MRSCTQQRVPATILGPITHYPDDSVNTCTSVPLNPLTSVHSYIVDKYLAWRTARRLSGKQKYMMLACPAALRHSANTLGVSAKSNEGCVKFRGRSIRSPPTPESSETSRVFRRIPVRSLPDPDHAKHMCPEEAQFWFCREVSESGEGKSARSIISQESGVVSIS